MPDRRYGLLVCIFAGSLVCSNFIASKVLVIGWLVFPAGVLAYPITFLATDVISEVWGKEAARSTVWWGLLSILLMLGLVEAALALPEASFSHTGASLRVVMKNAPRILLASLLAYLLAQHLDVVVFHAIRARTGPSKLWLRNTGSTVISQLMDTAVFVVVAFGGNVPASDLALMVLGQYILKVGIAVADTPFCYLLVRWARDETRTDPRGRRPRPQIHRVDR
jgi:uncharacterized integral membrane protein (TIGR00697 family)